MQNSLRWSLRRYDEGICPSGIIDHPTDSLKAVEDPLDSTPQRQMRKNEI
jgi:hypothetical protein